MTKKNFLNIHEIKASFSKYAAQVMKGKSFIIAQRNKPFAELRPLTTNAPVLPLKFGVFEGEFEVPTSFDDALVDFEQSFYGK